MVQAHIIVGSMHYPAIKSLFLSEPLGVLCGNAKKARLLSCSFCRIYGAAMGSNAAGTKRNAGPFLKVF